MTKSEHIWSYRDVEQLFMHRNPKVVRDVKDIYRVHFKPKHGTILVELKNGKGYLFSATSEKTGPKAMTYTCVTKTLTKEQFQTELDKIGRLGSHKKQVL